MPIIRPLMIRSLLLLLFICMSEPGITQEFDPEKWIDLADDDVYHIGVMKDTSFMVKDLYVVINWENEMVPNGDRGHIGGIKRMDIYKDKKLVSTFENWEDVLWIGEIYLRFFDFNMDGHLDFSTPIHSAKNRWDKYFLYNAEKGSFQHVPSWDFLRIQKVNKEEKRILSQPKELRIDDRVLYALEGNKLIEIKRLNE